MKTHQYNIDVTWTGNVGRGTETYTAYHRSHDLSAPGKPVLRGSSDPAFRGDPSCYNPEELLVGALSACHMLWFLHLAATAGVVVTEYVDRARGVMQERDDGSGEFVRVELHPRVQTRVVVEPATIEDLHKRSGEMCFIARSMNFPTLVVP